MRDTMLTIALQVAAGVAPVAHSARSPQGGAQGIEAGGQSERTNASPRRQDDGRHGPHRKSGVWGETGVGSVI